METAALVGISLFVLLSVIGSVWMLITAARVSTGWLLAVLLIPGAVLVFAARHWGVARKPFSLMAVPGLVGIGAAILIPNLVDRDPVGEIGELAEGVAEVADPGAASAPDLDRTAVFAERWLRGDPEVGCPPGASVRGARPPQGLEIWCEKEGLKHGPHASWYRDGRPATAGLFRNDEREGVWLRYNPKGGLDASASFEGGIQHGAMRTYDAFGRVERETLWVDGVPSG